MAPRLHEAHIRPQLEAHARWLDNTFAEATDRYSKRAPSQGECSIHSCEQRLYTARPGITARERAPNLAEGETANSESLETWLTLHAAKCGALAIALLKYTSQQATGIGEVAPSTPVAQVREAMNNMRISREHNGLFVCLTHEQVDSTTTYLRNPHAETSEATLQQDTLYPEDPLAVTEFIEAVQTHISASFSAPKF